MLRRMTLSNDIASRILYLSLLLSLSNIDRLIQLNSAGTGHRGVQQ